MSDRVVWKKKRIEREIAMRLTVLQRFLEGNWRTLTLLVFCQCIGLYVCALAGIGMEYIFARMVWMPVLGSILLVHYFLIRGSERFWNPFQNKPSRILLVFYAAIALSGAMFLVVEHLAWGLSNRILVLLGFTVAALWVFECVAQRFDAHTVTLGYGLSS